MSPVLIVFALLLVVLVALAIKATHVIPQASVAIVERFGRYRRTLGAGLNIVVPFIDSIRNRIDLREQVVPLPPQPVITQDNLAATIDTVVYYQVTDPRPATYEVASYIQAIEQLTVTTLRNIIGGMDLEQTLTSREEINAALRGVLDETAGKWGVRVNRIQLKAIEPPTSILDSMERQMRADRDKRAAILQAEGARQSDILRAEGEKQAAILRAESDVAVAEIHRRAAHAAAPAPVPAQPVQPVQPVRHDPLLPGDPRRLGRYRLTARLGEGGMGTVYLGLSPGERRVAVKVVRADLAADPGFRRRFSREIDSVRRVGGFHTAQVVDASSDGEQPWLVTEYIPGPSLAAVLREHGALPARTVRTLALGVAEALEGIHACGIVHRDLKPGNIIIAETGARVIDFGIARALDATALTRTDYFVGTQGFLAPEQLTGAPLTPAVDAYAFGMVLGHACGAAPFPPGAALEPALRLLPADLSAIVGSCLSPDPAARPTPAQILERLGGGDGKPAGDWLPPAVRTMVDLHNLPTVTAG
ncbi:SPFH domain-containing protein [Streptomyces sp. NPDC056492]|uniref:SPFH domain-containing protein n=1 Tax=unclassified Streptomyces TaxID=2593676 RepID=UPI0036CA6945